MLSVWRPDDKIEGKWVIAELTSPATSGLLHINSFILQRIMTEMDEETEERETKYYLEAADLHFTSIEGWSVQLWDGKRTQGGDSELYNLIARQVFSFIDAGPDGVSVGLVEQLDDISTRKPFEFTTGELSKYVGRSEMRNDQLIARKKFEDLIEVLEAQFGDNAAPIIKKMMQNKKKWEQ